MAKIILVDILSGFASVDQLNANFDALTAELQDKILYRDNPVGEPNSMQNDLDMNSNDILNTSIINTATLIVNGESLIPGSATTVPSATAVPYDNTTSGLTAGNVQAAIDEVDALQDTRGTAYTAAADRLSDSPYCTPGGSGTAFTLTTAYTPSVALAYNVGDKFRTKFSSSNTAGPVTIDIDGLGVKTAKTVTGVDLPADYFRTDAFTDITYDGTNLICDRQMETTTDGANTITRYANSDVEISIAETVTDQAISSVYGTIWLGTRPWVPPITLTAIYDAKLGMVKWGTGAPWGVVTSFTTSLVTLNFYDVSSRAVGTSFLYSASLKAAWY